MASDNKTLGRFDLIGIPPAPRGVPQVEVTFDIDANGIVHVSAKDMGTGKEQSIKITATSNLSEEEIEKMKKEAESHAEEDKKKREEIEVINQADALVYTSDKLFKDFKGKVDDKKVDDVKKDIEAIKKMLEPEAKDIPKIKQALEDINKKMQELSTELYQKAAAEQQAQAENPEEKDEEKVVDAEFEEVKKTKKTKKAKKGKK